MTPQQIQFAALRELGVVEVGGTPSAEQGVNAASKYASLYAQLLRMGLVRWSLTESVPTYAEQPVIWMLSYLCATSEAFGALPDKKAELAPLGALRLSPRSLGESQLRASLARDYVSQPVQSDYF